MRKNLILVLGAILMLSSCTEKKEPFEPAYKMDVEKYQSILDTSLLSTGNNFRLKKFIEKYKKGEEVYIAAIGGSVTEGAGPTLYTDGYFYQFVNRLKKEYNRDPKARTVINDAALSGTSSAIGWVRYEDDVINVMKHAPDLLIIEYAVNDYLEPTKFRGLEAMIRRALSDNPECAVIVLYAAATYGNQQAAMIPVAKYYQVAQISVSDAIKEPMESGLIKKEAYYTDSVHPFLLGHTLMTDCLLNLFRKVDAAKTDADCGIPEKTKLSPDFVNLVRIHGDDEFVKINPGSFTEFDPNCQVLKKTNKTDFPQNWFHKSGKESFVMNINCKNIIFIFKEGGAFVKGAVYGKAEVYVDGKLQGTYDANKEGGWNNCAVTVILDEAEAKDHLVEVRMVPGDEEKEFTIVAMAYSR